MAIQRYSSAAPSYRPSLQPHVGTSSQGTSGEVSTRQKGGISKAQADVFELPQGGKSSGASASNSPPSALGLKRGTVEELLTPYTDDAGQSVIDFNGLTLPVPAGGTPEIVPLSDNQVITLTPRDDGLIEARMRTIGLQADKKGKKFSGTLLADENGKLDIGGRAVDVSGMQPGERKSKTLNISLKTFKVKIDMNTDGTFDVEGQRKR